MQGTQCILQHTASKRGNFKQNVEIYNILIQISAFMLKKKLYIKNKSLHRFERSKSFYKQDVFVRHRCPWMI